MHVADGVGAAEGADRAGKGHGEAAAEGDVGVFAQGFAFELPDFECRRREGFVFAVGGAGFAFGDHAVVVGGGAFEAGRGLRDPHFRAARAERGGAGRDFGPVGGGFAIFEVVGGGGAFRVDRPVQGRFGGFDRAGGAGGGFGEFQRREGFVFAVGGAGFAFGN